MNKIINSIETDYNSIYTFSPNLNLTCSNNNNHTKIYYNTNPNNKNNVNSDKKIIKTKIPAYQRLYNDNQEKLMRQEETQTRTEKAAGGEDKPAGKLTQLPFNKNKDN